MCKQIFGSGSGTQEIPRTRWSQNIYCNKYKYLSSHRLHKTEISEECLFRFEWKTEPIMMNDDFPWSKLVNFSTPQKCWVPWNWKWALLLELEPHLDLLKMRHLMDLRRSRGKRWQATVGVKWRLARCKIQTFWGVGGALTLFVARSPMLEEEEDWCQWQASPEPLPAEIVKIQANRQLT